MALQSSIEWTESTWNPVTGCSKISADCQHCYAERLARRLQAMGLHRYRNGFQVMLHPDTRDVLTKLWTDWVDYWAVDFDYESRKEIIKVPKRMGAEDELSGVVKDDVGEFVDFEERWTGATFSRTNGRVSARARAATWK